LGLSRALIYRVIRKDHSGVGQFSIRKKQMLEAFTRFKDPKRYDPDTASVEQTFIYYGEFGSFFSSNTIYSSKPIVNASGLQLFTDIRPQQGTTMRISNTTDFATELELLQPVNQ
jgi:hypothetical protein